MLDVNLNLKQSSKKQGLFANEAIARLKTIVNNQSFLDAVFNAKYSRRELWLDNGKYEEATNKQILDIITSGKERLTKPNNSIDLQVALDRLGRRTVGVVVPPNPLITTNTSFFDFWMSKNDSLSLAAQWMHEWLHVAGFLHAGRRVDPKDVNYTIGNLVIKFGKTLAKGRGEPPKIISQLGIGYLEAVKEKLEL